MKKLFAKMEWILLFITLAPSILLYWLWEKIPHTIATHYNFYGEADDWNDKSLLLWLIPSMSVLLYLILLLVPIIDPKKRIESMGGKYFALRVVVLSLIAAILFIFILSSAYPNLDFRAGLFPILSIFLILMGNYLQAVKPNYFIGIRTPWTLNDEKNWQLTHRLGGRVYMLGGLILLLASLFLSEFGFYTVFLIGMLLIIFIPVIYSFWLFAFGKTAQ